MGGTDSREGCRRTEIKTSFVGHWVMPPSQNIAVEGTEAQPLKSKTTLTSFTSTVRRYFATVGGMGDQETQVERKVIASSPIMEAIDRVGRRGLSAWPQGTVTEDGDDDDEDDPDDDPPASAAPPSTTPTRARTRASTTSMTTTSSSRLTGHSVCSASATPTARAWWVSSQTRLCR